MPQDGQLPSPTPVPVRRSTRVGSAVELNQQQTEQSLVERERRVEQWNERHRIAALENANHVYLMVEVG